MSYVLNRMMVITYESEKIPMLYTCDNNILVTISKGLR